MAEKRGKAVLVPFISKVALRLTVTDSYDETKGGCSGLLSQKMDAGRVSAFNKKGLTDGEKGSQYSYGPRSRSEPSRVKEKKKNLSLRNKLSD